MVSSVTSVPSRCLDLCMVENMDQVNPLSHSGCWKRTDRLINRYSKHSKICLNLTFTPFFSEIVIFHWVKRSSKLMSHSYFIHPMLLVSFSADHSTINSILGKLQLLSLSTSFRYFPSIPFLLCHCQGSRPLKSVNHEMSSECHLQVPLPRSSRIVLECLSSATATISSSVHSAHVTSRELALMDIDMERVDREVSS